jgi:hypothetical protein
MNMKNFGKIGPLFLGFATCCSFLGPTGGAHAQVAVAEVDPQPKPPLVRFHGGYTHLKETDMDRRGDFQRNSFRVGAAISPNLTESLALDNFLVYENNHYNFSGSSRFQWDTTHFVAYAPLLRWKTSPQWTLMGGPLLLWQGESGVDFSDGFTGGGLLGFNYMSSPTFSIGLLIGAIDQIEDDPIVAPLPLINWKFADSWMLRTGLMPLGGRGGLGAELSWQLVQDFSLVGGIQFQRRRFRLDTQDQIGRDTGVPVYAKLVWQMVPQGSAELFGGVYAGGELRLENKNGKKIREEDYDTAPIFGGKVTFAF